MLRNLLSRRLTLLACVVLVSCGSRSPLESLGGGPGLQSGPSFDGGGGGGTGVSTEGAAGSQTPPPDFDFTPQPDVSVSYQIDVAHSGRQLRDTLRPPLRKRWSHPFEGAISYPIIADGRVIVVSQTKGNQDPTIYAFDSKSGALLWQAGPYRGRVGGESINVAYDRRTVFVATDQGSLHALDGADGNERWSRTVSESNGFTSVPIAAGGVVFVTTPRGLFTVDQNTGSPVYESTSALVGIPTLGAERLVLSTACHETQCLDAKTGLELWHFRGDCVGGGGMTSAVFGGRAFVPDVTSDPFFVLDVATGDKIREVPTAFYSPCFDDGVGFFTDVGKITAVDLSTWSSRWSYEAPSSFFGPSIVVAGIVYAVDESGLLLLLDGKSGQVIASERLADPDPNWHNPSPAPQRGLGAGEGVIAIPLHTELFVYESAGT